MKKITSIFFFTIYSLTTLGIGIRQFYCCGKLKSTTITLLQESKVKCGNADAMKGCCKIKFKSLKAKDNHIASDAGYNFVKHFTELDLTTASFELKPLTVQPINVAHASHAPPLHYGVPIYILHCIFRI